MEWHKSIIGEIGIVKNISKENMNIILHIQTRDIIVPFGLAGLAMALGSMPMSGTLVMPTMACS